MRLRGLLALSLFFLFLAVSFVFAYSFDASMSPTTADAGVSNRFLNFTITNNGPGNVTQLNITLPENFDFVGNSNGTSSSNWEFSSISDTQPVLIWDNTTTTGFIDDGTTEYFWLNISVPKGVGGTYYFDVTILNTTNSTNSTNVSIYIYPTVWSSNSTFYVKPAETYLNWTNTNAAGNYTKNITIIGNATNPKEFNITVFNKLTTPPYFSYLKPNYTQNTGGERSCSNIGLSVMNSSGDYNSTFVTKLNGSDPNNNKTDVALTVSYPTAWWTCHPGHYFTNTFIVRNDNMTDEANISIHLDIPIRPINTTGVGSFNGKFSANATKYHSFFFNASNSKSAHFINGTSVFINVTADYDLDVFLFDENGVMRGNAINKTAGDEIIRYNYLESSDGLWEIRIYGNSSTSEIQYSGKIIFTGLNTTNSSGHTIQVIDFGTLNETENNTAEITVKNKANISMNGVTEQKELYLLKKFSGSSAANHTILLPLSTIERLKVRLNWTGAANYSFNVYNPSDSFVMGSVGKHKYANISKAVQEEYNQTSDMGSVSGVWTIEVLNNSKYLDEYNLTIYGYVDASDWLATNFTSYDSSLKFNRSGKNNSTYSFQTNITVPSNARNGLYEGHLKYLDSRGAGISVPLRANVTTPVLTVNNTMYSGSYRLDENYGANLTRIMYFKIKNFGDLPFYLNFTNSTNLTGGGYNASLTHNKTTGKLDPGSSAMMQVNISFNSSMPARTYAGWIKINATNQSDMSTAKSYSLYTIYLTLNLTNLLDVRISARTDNGTNSFVLNSTTAKNITVLADIYYINGTGPITDLGGLNNFTGVWLQETNITDKFGRILKSGSLDMHNGTDDPQAPYCTGTCPFRGDDHYFVNATVPQNSVGGRYKVYMNVSYNTDSATYKGTGYSLTNETLIIDDTGLYMSAMNSTSIVISNGSSYYFYINVSNYGPAAGDDAIINITKPSKCSGYSVEADSYSCPGWPVNPTGVKFTFDPPKYNTSCYMVWKITAGDDKASECKSKVLGDSLHRWFNPNGINITVRVSKPSTTTTTTSGGYPAYTPPTYVMNLSLTKTHNVIYVVQNSSNTTTVTVKNTGNKSHEFNFSITDIESSWYTINGTNASLLVNRKVTFLINFTIGMVDIKDYSGKFKAHSPNTTITSDFVLRVLPAPEKETEIGDILVLYRVNMTKTWVKINQSGEEGINTTLAESKILQAKEKIDLAEEYINQGKYFEAYQLFDDIKTLIAGAETSLSAATQTYEESKLPVWVYWVIGIVAITAIVLAYLLWPEPGYSPKKKRYTYRTPQQIGKEKLSDFRHKLSRTVFGKPYTAVTKPTKAKSYEELRKKYGKPTVAMPEVKPPAPVAKPTGRFSTARKKESVIDKSEKSFKNIYKKVSKFIDDLGKKKKPWKSYK